MTREDARREAQAVADADGIVMAVTFDPYAETLDEEDKFGYMPLEATKIFLYEKSVETIRRRSSS